MYCKAYMIEMKLQKRFFFFFFFFNLAITWDKYTKYTKTKWRTLTGNLTRDLKISSVINKQVGVKIINADPKGYGSNLNNKKKRFQLIRRTL